MSARRSDGLLLALGGGLALLLLSYFRSIWHIAPLLFHNSVVNSIDAGPLLGTALARNLGRFGATLLLLHLLYGLGCWLAARAARVAWPRSGLTTRHWVLVWLCAATITLLIANARYFPNSSLGEPYAQWARSRWLGIDPATVALATFAAALALTLARAWHQAAPARRALTIGTTAGASVVLAAVAINGFAHAPIRYPRQVAAEPNLILIGVDSLRPDSVTPATTPAIAEFLAGGVRFTDATTPIARTFPSWVSILTGNGPRRTGAVVNLAPRASVHVEGSLPGLLRAHGYYTAYAISETRFSNIDASYGFDTVVSPPLGASDFLIGWFGDAPLLNFLVNTDLGGAALPNLHGNRAAAATFEPAVFRRRFERELAHRAPLFLARHFMLPHWPYFWGDAPADRRPGPAGFAARYAAAVARSDQQFAMFMDLLRTRGVLDNAIVVVLSDHGETFGDPRESLLPLDEPRLRALGAVPNWGHGTSVLEPLQYHVVLGMRAYGAAAALIHRRGDVSAPVSLEDLAPTLLDLLGIAGPATDGRSLKPLLQGTPGAEATFADRIRVTETEFNPTGVIDAAGEVSSTGVAAASLYYELDPVSDRLEMRAEKLNQMVARRQFAAFGADEILAALPLPDAQGFQLLVVQPRRGTFAWLDSPPSPRTDPQRARLWDALRARLGHRLVLAP